MATEKAPHVAGKGDRTNSKPAAKTQAVKEEATRFPHSSRLDPQALTNLAVNLLAVSVPERGSIQGGLSDPANDPLFQDALKRAELMLIAAAGQSDEDVQAYQLFEEEASPMTFAEIARRFNEASWDGMNAPNTVDRVMKSLVQTAKEVIQSEIEKLGAAIAAKGTSPYGFDSLAERARDSIDRMMQDPAISSLFEEPQKISEAMNQYFIRLLKGRLTGSWQRNHQDDSTAIWGFNHFLIYVCDDLPFEKFVAAPKLFPGLIRKCRPHELFRFAAEKRLLPNKLIRKRSELNCSFFPWPKISEWKQTSILEVHRGAEIAAGFRQLDEA